MAWKAMSKCHGLELVYERGEDGANHKVGRCPECGVVCWQGWGFDQIQVDQ